MASQQDLAGSRAAIRGDASAIERHRAIVRRFTDEFINTGDAAIAEEILAADARLYFAGAAEPLRGPAGFLRALGELRAAFPDIRWKIEQLVAEDDCVAARFSFAGTHRGEFLDVPPSGASVRGQGMAFFRFADGRIVEDHALPNLLGVLRQIAPAPGGE